jgi:PleD family two-component response regulator
MSTSLVPLRRYLPAGALPAPVCVLAVGRGGRVEKALRASPIAVQAVEAGPAALDYVANELPTDVVVIESARADDQVVALIDAVRRHRYWRSVPILLFAPHSEPVDLDRAFEAGADECLASPDPATLASRVRQFAAA